MDDVFFIHAERVISSVLNRVRPDLMHAYGTVAFETKKDHTVVTALDQSIEQELRLALSKLDAGIGFKGEEMGQAGSSETYWLLDPIDGTEHFIRGMPGCKNMVCLMQGGRPVWGLTYFFVKDERWIAQAGKGVTMNGQRVEMRYRPLDRCWIEVVVDYSDLESVKKLMKLRSEVAGFCNRLGIDNLTAGRTDGLIDLKAGGGPWDYWPRYLMFTEAGGKMANVGKQDYHFEDKSIVMAHPKNFDALMRIVTT